MRRLHNFLSSQTRPVAPRARRAYVVGDIHGRLDLLTQLLGLIEDDLRGRRKLKTSIVFLGDLIDRGPESSGVVDFLESYRPAFATPLFLMGNHEEIMLRVLGGEGDLLGQWLKFGGAECVQSYGMDPLALKRMPREQAIELLRKHIPARHIAFMSGFADTISFGSYLFVHAGIRPGTSLADQSRTDLRWIREPFLQDQRDHGHIIVHGHTICEEIETCPNRIGIDTGAYRTGVLTALGIEGTERWFLQTDNARVEFGDIDPSGGLRAAGQN